MQRTLLALAIVGVPAFANAEPPKVDWARGLVIAEGVGVAEGRPESRRERPHAGGANTVRGRDQVMSAITKPKPSAKNAGTASCTWYGVTSV
jgi:hypothetical protein